MNKDSLMAGLFGWYGNSVSSDPGEARRVLGQMCHGARFSAETHHNAAVAVTSPTDGKSMLRSEDLLVAIVGHPVWKDGDLAALASRDGHAAALAQAYRNDGLELFRRLGGYFSFSIADQKAGRVVAAIDRMGIGRLYYACPEDGGIVFGTTADGVRKYPRLSATLSPQGLYDYLFFFMSPAPGTIYAEQKKLLGAQYLVFENGSVRTQFHWRMPYREHSDRSTPELEAQLRELLGDAVDDALKQANGGQVGAFLSGGLDSSTMVGLIERSAPGKATCFTIGFDADGYDEMPYAKLAAKHFNCRHHPHYLTNDDLMDAISHIVESYDEPYGNSSAVPTYVCAKVARENGVDTMIAGDGGDELFAGNERYVSGRIFDYYARLPKFVRRGLIEPAVSILSQSFETAFFRRCRNFVQFANIDKPERPFARNLYGEAAANGVFDPDFLRNVDVSGPMRDIRAIIERAESSSDVQRMMHTDLQRTLSDNDLVKVRRMCESAGVDVVFPFLDDRVVEFAAGIPEATMLPEGQLRGFYKSAFRDFLPRETIEKQKHGFGIPSMAWSREVPALRDMLHDKISRFGERGIFRKSYLDSMINSLVANREVTTTDVQLVSSAWDVMMLEMWLTSRQLT